MPDIIADPANEFIDDSFYDDRMTHDNYANIDVPLLTAGNWVNYTSSRILSDSQAH